MFRHSSRFCVLCQAPLTRHSAAENTVLYFIFLNLTVLVVHFTSDRCRAAGAFPLTLKIANGKKKCAEWEHVRFAKNKSPITVSTLSTLAFRKKKRKKKCNGNIGRFCRSHDMMHYIWTDWDIFKFSKRFLKNTDRKMIFFKSIFKSFFKFVP